MTATGVEATQERAPGRRRRFEGIEGLRGIAALAVLAHHVAVHLGDGDQLGPFSALSWVLMHGLTLFFALSGFLLYKPFCDAVLSQARRPSIRRYAGNRFLRIYPAYFVIFVLVSFVFGAAYLGGAPATSHTVPVGRLTDPLDIVTGLLLVQTYFPSTLGTGIGPAWSLTTEVAFYVVLPLLALVAYRIGRRVSPLAAALFPPVVLIAVGWATKAWGAIQTSGMSMEEYNEFAWGQNWTAVVERSLLMQADLFGYGMLVAFLLSVAAEKVRLGPFALLSTLGAAGVLVVGASRGFPDEHFANAVAGMAAALVIGAVALPDRGGARTWVAGLLERQPFRFYGEISYSVYLWHVPVIWWLHGQGWVAGEGRSDYLVNVALVVAVVTVLSTLTYRLVERPALQLKRRT